MQSFRERGGFQGNQRCYQQESHELSRLENYRHHSQTGQSYEVHSLPAAGVPTAGTSSKDCYGQQPYPSYGSSSAQSKKSYRGGKASSQHLQAGYSSHMNSGYSSQYMSEGHLQQKWGESGQISQYEQDIVGHLEAGTSGSSQYLEQNMLAISQSQCHLPSQPSAPVYTSPHQQGHPPNPTPSPLIYPQSHIHFPQHSQTPSATSSSYMEKCNTIPLGYKTGYGMPPNAQYSRQMGNHSSLKQSGYRPQNNYGYQQPPSRAGFEQQPPLQAMSSAPESLQKFSHYNQTQQNYCITDISVRSPEQYYQNCSPSSSHSPARSVGRSPSYSSTPSPLMPNPDTFQYSQPTNPSSSSVNLQDPNMLMPPHTHPSPSVNHQSQNYSSAMKDRFSEKLFSNPSLWSLNALTSQVENISNNVQQLLLSEALMANKKGNKRNQMKKGEEYRGHLKAMEDSSCPDSQHVPLLSDSYGTPRSMPSDLLEVGYTSSADEQMERTYYYFGQGKGSTQASAQSQLSLDTVSTCSINSTDDMSVRSGDSDRSIQSAASEDNLSCDPRVQRVAFGEEQHSSLISNRNESSPISVTATSPMKQETNSQIGIKQSENTQKENFEESAWTERINDEKESEKNKLSTEQKCKGEDFEATEKPQEWFEDEKCPSFFHKLNKEVSNESFCYETEDNIYQKLKNKYETEKGDFAERCCDTRREVNEDANMKSESQNKVDDPITASPVILKDVPDSSLYLPRKVESSETHHLTSGCEFSKERQSTPERQNELFEEQSAHSYSVTEVREKKRESLTSSEDVINNKVKLEDFFKEACNNQGGEANGPLCVVNTEIAETPAQDLAHRSNERTLVTCDIAPQSHPVRSGFSTLNEKTTPQNQVRDHSDAKVLEPDSPQLPGKSIISSAPSWADTPPSPQKGDEDVEPGISCPSATKPEPMTSSAHPRLLGRKHARGRRRLIHSSTGMRSMERDGAQSSAQKPSTLLNNNATFSDQMEAVQLDISSQTPKLLTEGLPSRMCTRSLGSQITPKGCSQEKGKPSPKSRSKPGPKQGPKPGTKPVVKLSSKPVLKTGPKQGPKPTSKPGQKASPKVGAKPSTKQNSKPGPKQCPKPGAVPSVKSGPKPVPKPSAIPALKFGPKSGLKPTEGVTPKGPGRPKGLNPKIKSMKYENYTDSIPKHIEDASCMTETPEQEDHTEVSLETVVGTTLHTSIDSTMDSTLDTALDATFVNSAKDQKSMVLRSRKQTREKLTEDKEKETDISTEALAIKSTESHIVAAAQPCENLTSTLKSPDHDGISTESLIQLNEQIVSVSIKRKSSLQAPDSIKKKKSLRVSQTKTQESQPQELAVDAQGSKGSRKRGHKLEQSACSTLTKDNLVLEDIIDTPCVPPQCPTKTKYLPPRKGRGLKYEAMVQKITSPASKKQPLNIQPDVVLEELAPKQSPELQVQEKRRAVYTTMVTLEKVESTVSIEETPGTECIQTPRKKRKKWATVESTNTPDIAMETGSLIINTPRLAKQRAIKNNHEMHLKQRKKRRKGPELAKSMPIVETHEQTDVFNSSNAPAPSPPPTSSLFSNTEEKTQGEQLTIEKDLTVIKLKRGRRPSLKKKQEDDLRQPVGKEEGQKVKKKPGPRKKTQQNNSSTIKVTVKGFKPKIKCKKEWTPIVKGTLTNFLKTSDNKPSFRPYIHIDSSKMLASLCKLINKPEEERLLVQIRKKNLEKNRIIPNSSIMLQGPLVNRSLTDKCLICCLCGKPSNYKELGDLCGPYYPENTIPRKTLSLTYHEDFRRNRDREPDKEAMCSSEQINDMKNDGEKDLLQEGKSEGDCRLLMRERRAQHRSRLGLRARFKRLPLLQGRAGGGVPPAGEEGSYSVLQRLQLEAEANEHWSHEACTVWTSGVILIAGKLYGLKEAARESTLTKCSKCQTEGASISCSWKNCINKYHYVCAKDTGCTFDEDTFLIKCPKHQAM